MKIKYGIRGVERDKELRHRRKHKTKQRREKENKISNDLIFDYPNSLRR